MKKNKDSILKVMIVHHGLLEGLLKDIQESLEKDGLRVLDLLEEFQWELKKHIFSEEKVIFQLYKKENSEIRELIKKIEQSHTEMMDVLGDLKDDFVTEAKKDITDFQKMIEKHKKIEEEKLYPLLDKELDTETKKQIISQITEIPIKK